MELTVEQLGDLMTKAAAEGLRVGKAGTDGDHTDSGIAVKVLWDAGLLGIKPLPYSEADLAVPNGLRDLMQAEAES